MNRLDRLQPGINPGPDRPGYLKRIAAAACAVCASFAANAQTVPVPRASITPADLGVVILQGDPTSEAIGSYYQSVRGIPAANVVRISLPTGVDNISPSQLASVRAQITAALPANVQATLLTWTRPFRVQGACGMSITSAFALGYDVKYCNAVFTAPVAYYDADTTRPWTDLGVRPAMMLGAATYADAVNLIHRGLSSEATYPSGDGYLIRTTDSARSGPRWQDFSKLPSAWSFDGGLRLNYIDNAKGGGANAITGKSPVLFYFTGLTDVPALASNFFVPGAVGDHLTSFGGVLSGTYQMEATEWLQAGATGSYGTVEEPYAVADKFPRASVMIDHYFRGATLIEAYWKSVRTPGQGLFLGDPLARPFTDAPTSTISNGQYLVQTRALRGNQRYAIQARDTANGPWQTLSSTWLPHPGPATLKAPVASSANAQLRLQGCPLALAVEASSTSEAAQRGRAQTLYYQLQLTNTATAESACEQHVDLTALPLPEGMVAAVEPKTLQVRPQQTVQAIVKVEAPATAAAAEDTCFEVPLQLTDRTTGQSSQINQLGACLFTMVGDEYLIRIRRPSWNWQLLDGPERTSFYRYPVELDAPSDQDIVRVSYGLQALYMDDGTDPTQYGLVSGMNAVAGPEGNYASELVIGKAAPGTYSLQANAFDSNSQLVASTEVYVYLGMQVNTVLGTPSRDTLVGTAGNDIIIGGQGADLMSGGQGKDIFVFESIRDAMDQITDFVPGTDRLDLSQLLSSIGQSTRTAWPRGVVTLRDVSGGVLVLIDADGPSGPGAPRPLVTLMGVSAAAIDPVRDLQLQR